MNIEKKIILFTKLLVYGLSNNVNDITTTIIIVIVIFLQVPMIGLWV